MDYFYCVNYGFFTSVNFDNKLMFWLEYHSLGTVINYVCITTNSKYIPSLRVSNNNCFFGTPPKYVHIITVKMMLNYSLPPGRICSSIQMSDISPLRSEFLSTLDWKVKNLQPLCVGALAYQSGVACCLQKEHVSYTASGKRRGLLIVIF